MIVTDLTRRALAVRREDRRLKALGYRKHETDWEIHRGGRGKERIVDAQISVCGKYVWTKLGRHAENTRPITANSAENGAPTGGRV